jgi:hypothetical protein
MADTFNRHGVQTSIATDGFWLDQPEGAAPATQSASGLRRWRGLDPAGQCAVLVPRAGSVAGALRLGCLCSGTGTALQGEFGVVVLMILGSLPVIDVARALSMPFLIAALLIAQVCVWLPHGGFAMILTAATRLMGKLPCHRLVTVPYGVRG